MEIAKAEYIDLPNILAMQKLAYLSEAELINNYSIQPLTQTIEELQREFTDKVILKAVTSSNINKIVGSVRGYAEGNMLFIGKLIVHPDFQNQGLGTKLLYAIENCFPNMRYELFTSNKSTKNLALYTKNGYIEYKREKKDNNLELVYLQK